MAITDEWNIAKKLAEEISIHDEVIFLLPIQLHEEMTKSYKIAESNFQGRIILFKMRDKSTKDQS